MHLVHFVDLKVMSSKKKLKIDLDLRMILQIFNGFPNRSNEKIRKNFSKLPFTNHM